MAHRTSYAIHIASGSRARIVDEFSETGKPAQGIEETGLRCAAVREGLKVALLNLMHYCPN